MKSKPTYLPILLVSLILSGCQTQAPSPGEGPLPPPPTPPPPTSTHPAPSPSPLPPTITPISVPTPQTDELIEIPVHLGGMPAGILILGQTTLEEAVALLPPPPPGLEGGPRPANMQLPIGDHILTPSTVFNPTDSMYILFFDDRDILVLVVDGSVIGDQRSVQDLIDDFPDLHTTHDEPNWSEMQAALTQCATLVAVFTASRKLDSMGYAYTCPTA